MSDKKSPGAVAILTSGGDAPGMNACVRGCVRAALDAGFQVYAILEGYQGLIDDRLEKLEWEDVKEDFGYSGLNLRGEVSDGVTSF